MDINKGLAYCGLACMICSENQNCVGCRNDGCKDKEWCKNYNCCKKKGINGCWQCDEFPCSNTMLDKIRIRAFAIFAKKYGEDYLIECLKHNEEKGIIYHYKGELIGDYDKFNTEDEIIRFIKSGR